jgi:hypothetical protein
MLRYIGLISLLSFVKPEATSLDLNLSVWQIPVFRYGLLNLMRNQGYIEFETLGKKVLVISEEY